MSAQHQNMIKISFLFYENEKKKNIIKIISLPKSYRMKMFERKAENMKREMDENLYNVEFKNTRTRTVANTNIIIINLK